MSNTSPGGKNHVYKIAVAVPRALVPLKIWQQDEESNQLTIFSSAPLNQFNVPESNSDHSHTNLANCDVRYLCTSSSHGWAAAARVCCILLDRLGAADNTDRARASDSYRFTYEPVQVEKISCKFWCPIPLYLKLIWMSSISTSMLYTLWQAGSSWQYRQSEGLGYFWTLYNIHCRVRIMMIH